METAVAIALIIYWLRHGNRREASAGKPTNSKVTLVFWLIVLVMVALTMTSHRPDADDAHFINFATNAVNDPQGPLLHFDGKVNIPGALEVLRVRKVHSFEPLAAAIAFLTGLEPIIIFHLVFPPLAAILVCLGQRELLQVVAPRYWLFAFAAAMVFLCVNGEIHRTYGNFCFVRLHQGKSIMLSAIVPIIISSGFRFGLNPSRRNWLRLSGAQICAMGFTVNALWLAPLAGILSIGAASGFPGRADGLKTWVLGVLASFYVMGMGFYFRFFEPLPNYHRITLDSGYQFLLNHFQHVFTFHAISWLQLGIALTAWMFCKPGLTRRFFVFCLITVAVMANPLTAKLVAANLTGTETYWRVFWLFPMPAMVGLVSIWPVSKIEKYWGPGKRNFAFCLLLIGLTAMGWNQNVFRRDNYNVMGVPQLKVTREFPIAVQLRDSLPERPNIIGPERITQWVTTLLGHPYPLLSRNRHSRIYREEGHTRLIIKQYVSGTIHPPNGPRLLSEAFKRYHIGAICLPLGNPWAGEIREVLKCFGLEISFKVQDIEVWVRPAAAKNISPNCL